MIKKIEAIVIVAILGLVIYMGNALHRLKEVKADRDRWQCNAIDAAATHNQIIDSLHVRANAMELRAGELERVNQYLHDDLKAHKVEVNRLRHASVVGTTSRIDTLVKIDTIVINNHNTYRIDWRDTHNRVLVDIDTTAHIQYSGVDTITVACAMDKRVVKRLFGFIPIKYKHFPILDVYNKNKSVDLSVIQSIEVLAD